MRRKLSFHTLMVLVLALSACSGGGSGGDAPASGSSSQSGNTPTSTTNQIALMVDSGPAGTTTINELYTSVTICAPGTSICQTIDHILVDTGSTGLRLMASELDSAMLAALPSSFDSGGDVLAECAQFVDGYTWGPIRFADIKLGGENASNVAIQVVGAPNFAGTPLICQNTGVAENTVQSFGAKGIIGISVFTQDCGQYCATHNPNGMYYTCHGSVCSATLVPLAKQLWNPVALFPTDNNGTMISLPSVPSNGATSVTGTLTFGIATQTNNQLANAAVLTVDPIYGELTATVGSTTYTGSFLDTGSNAYFYDIGLFPHCQYLAGFYCPSNAQGQSGILQGRNGQTLAADFIVGNPELLLAANPNIAVYSQLAGPSGMSGVDFGLPFFLGRTVFTAIENRTTPAGTGPWLGIIAN